ncbi:MAG: hypothetical protein ABIH00_03215 [Armatimonadota bacterium]
MGFRIIDAAKEKVKFIPKEASAGMKTQIKLDSVKGKGARVALAEMLNFFDKDINGTLEGDELKALYKVVGESISVKEVADVLIKKSTKGEFTEKLHAVSAMGHLGTVTDEVVPALIDAVKRDSDILCCGAASSLGIIGEKARPAVPALAAKLKDETVAEEAYSSITFALAVIIPKTNRTKEEESAVKLINEIAGDKNHVFQDYAKKAQKLMNQKKK